MQFILPIYEPTGLLNKDILPLLDQSFASSQVAPGNIKLKVDLSDMCCFVVDTNLEVLKSNESTWRIPNRTFHSKVVGRVIEALLWLREYPVIPDALSCVIGELPLDTYRAMGPLLRVPEFPQIQRRYEMCRAPLTSDTANINQPRSFNSLKRGCIQQDGCDQRTARW